MMLDKFKIDSRRQILFIYTVLIVATLAVYWQVHQFGFINIDDPTFVNNSYVRQGVTLSGVRWAFSTTYAGFWHPLTWLSFMLDSQIYGLNARGYHTTNLFFHLSSTLLLFWLFIRMTGMVWRSTFIAFLFALHPHHVESVAWIAERKDVLCAFFWMLTLFFYVCYTKKPDIKRYLLTLLCFVLALMSKSMVITLPVIMILLDYWPLQRYQSGKGSLMLWQLKEKWPFLLLSIVFSITTLSIWNDPKEVEHTTLNFRFSNATVAFAAYLQKIFWPHDMHLFHPFSDQLPFWQVIIATLIIFLISVSVITAAKRFPYLFTGWLWYAVILLPVLGITQSGVYWMHEHYTYLPSIGIGIMLGWGLPGLNIHKKILFPAGIGFLVLMAVISWQECHYWKNSITLFSHAIKIVEKDKYLAYYNRARAYDSEGLYQSAIQDYNMAIHLKPDFPSSYHGRGTSYGKMGQYDPAINDFNKAISLNPDDAEVYNNRGIVYTKLNLHGMAITDFDKAISLKEDYSNPYLNRATVYFIKGDNVLACRDIKKACALGSCTKLKAAEEGGYCR